MPSSISLIAPPSGRRLFHTAITSRTIQSFLQQEQSTLCQSPILVISSGTKKSGTTFTQQVEFYGQQAMGLSMIPTITIDSAYPIQQQHVPQILQLQQRTGATTLMGVGSGVAIDLAKSVSQNFEQCYLVPATDAALFAASSHCSMLLDNQEETIVTKPVNITKDITNTTIVTLEEEEIVPHADTKAACQSILLDSESPSSNEVLDSLLSKDATHWDWIQATAPHLQDGTTGSNRRSIPLALSCSLIPPMFSSAHVLTFWAALSPAAPSFLASLALEAHTVEKLMQYVRANQAAQPNVLDAADDEIEMVLSTSLNR
eukprot:CAMPEP_0178920472 /NCGR_PEP_ID=MMETSP0786-20121207/15025_1 /TAXON_ID=186022 /ORGANISM="Thalassionema frauenfeldii, Strain CCMP 1798" /LENGTH=315 /DNA_ID=CAMNT_0020594545 /DNA_START=78 /DNA_END=1025 /DNA_ORIENTATION=-